jgi:tellurite resistance protein
MLKQLHQLTHTIEGKTFTFNAEVVSQITEMENALMAFMQFLGSVKAQQEAAQKAAQAAVAPVLEESKQPPEVVD